MTEQRLNRIKELPPLSDWVASRIVIECVQEIERLRAELYRLRDLVGPIDAEIIDGVLGDKQP
jgi:hypothetical protein